MGTAHIYNFWKIKCQIKSKPYLETKITLRLICVMILPSCLRFFLVLWQDHDRPMICVQAHGLCVPCACAVSLHNPDLLLSSSCHYCLVSFTCPPHLCSPYLIPLCLLSCVGSLFDMVILCVCIYL